MSTQVSHSSPPSPATGTTHLSIIIPLNIKNNTLHPHMQEPQGSQNAIGLVWSDVAVGPINVMPLPHILEELRPR